MAAVFTRAADICPACASIPSAVAPWKWLCSPPRLAHLNGKRRPVHIVDGAIITAQVAGIQTLLGGPIGDQRALARGDVDLVGQHVTKPTAAAVQGLRRRSCCQFPPRRAHSHASARAGRRTDVLEHLLKARLDGLGIVGAEVAAATVDRGMPEVVDGLRLRVAVTEMPGAGQTGQAWHPVRSR